MKAERLKKQKALEQAKEEDEREKEKARTTKEQEEKKKNRQQEAEEKWQQKLEEATQVGEDKKEGKVKKKRVLVSMQAQRILYHQIPIGSAVEDQ